jgi:hypothetical protein
MLKNLKMIGKLVLSISLLTVLSFSTSSGAHQKIPFQTEWKQSFQQKHDCKPLFSFFLKKVSVDFLDASKEFRFSLLNSIRHCQTCLKRSQNKFISAETLLRFSKTCRSLEDDDYLLIG